MGVADELVVRGMIHRLRLAPRPTLDLCAHIWRVIATSALATSAVATGILTTSVLADSMAHRPQTVRGSLVDNVPHHRSWRPHLLNSRWLLPTISVGVFAATSVTLAVWSLTFAHLHWMLVCCVAVTSAARVVLPLLARRTPYPLE